MLFQIEIPDYTPESGIDYEWADGHEIAVTLGANEVRISANKAGLITLARFLLNLAQDEVRSGTHIHFDSGIALEDRLVPQ